MTDGMPETPGGDPGPPPGDRTTTFFPEPMVDQLLRAITSLAMELSVTRERLDTLERHLAVPADALDSFAFDAAAAAERAARRRALIAEVLDPIADALEKSDPAADGVDP